ncbi:polysaccharide pyruvyl transferase family protein [Nodosilinea sp. LEGE 06152]|uniref:polysaccharide pyruvyl transferase family protein n=1 Tax=Nodosilinea sp. LEGE 06152 TaxID=2777966 RepID=UPI001882DC42|nr:polysaccharide pyruvyl transferase family protein [Nodosilinea sp. LEGE 06152]MBE9158417.1 polysaccharide pyruvyl transferase family protein [Nodosilinea sp. LEGE 06152]
MRILVENSGYRLLNMGDLAMLTVALSRLDRLFPHSSIQVLTSDPEKLSEIFPSTKPISVQARMTWFSPLAARYYQLPLIRYFSKLGLFLENLLRRHKPTLFLRILSLKLKKKAGLLEEVRLLMDALYRADIVIATGGGYITDEFKCETQPRLAMLSLANQLGIPTILVGQGLGPVQDLELQRQIKKTLAQADLICLREQLASVALINYIGIPNVPILITGDDAIELAYKARTEHIGSGIGINLRVAPYSEVGESIVQTLRLVFLNIASKFQASLIPIPIDHSAYDGLVDPDSTTIEKLVGQDSRDLGGGAELDTPLKIIEQVGRCRVVITGSYHAGVFALSQGIPVVGLAKSKYYVDKFFGLADQFGVGCSVLMLDEIDLENKLTDCTKNLWNEAETLRPILLDAARAQIQAGIIAYQKILEEVKLKR